MAYRIEITNIDQVPQTETQWRKVSDDINRPKQYEYVKPAEGSMRQIEVKVYEQVVADLDLKRVILAINDAFEIAVT